MDTSPLSERADEVAVLVPAAGRGSRLGGRRKQFRPLGDQPVLVQTLLAFERHPGVGHLVVAAPNEEVREVSDRLQAEGLGKLTAVVGGGDSRQASVRKALRAVPAPVEVVLVHDAVRPFLPAGRITAVVEAVRAEGAAALALPVADTLRRAADDAFGETVSRDGLYRMQTPQGFRRAWLEAAHRRAKAAPDGEPAATDDVELVQRSGREVATVRGTPENFKITTPGDWDLARQLWPRWVDANRRPARS
jgi:2-C-methyl-D-erythritol 4-phosphate cytidylyltransferase